MTKRADTISVNTPHALKFWNGDRMAVHWTKGRDGGETFNMVSLHYSEQNMATSHIDIKLEEAEELVRVLQKYIRILGAPANANRMEEVR